MLPAVSPLSSAKPAVGATPRFGKIDVTSIQNLCHNTVQSVAVTLTGPDRKLKPYQDIPDSFLIIRGVDPNEDPASDRLQLIWSTFETRQEIKKDLVTGQKKQQNVVFEHSEHLYTGDKARFKPLFTKMAARSGLPNWSLKKQLMAASIHPEESVRTCSVAKEMTRYSNLSFDTLIQQAEISKSIAMALATGKSTIYKPAPATEDARYKYAVALAAGRVLKVTQDTIQSAKIPNDVVHKALMKALDVAKTVMASQGVPEADHPKAIRDALTAAEKAHSEIRSGFDFRYFETMPEALEQLKAWSSPAKQSVITHLNQRLAPSLEKLREFTQPHLSGMDPGQLASPAFWLRMPLLPIRKNYHDN